MPGADASQYTKFKKHSANQRGDTQQTDPKSVNRLTQYISRVSNVSSVGEFLPSLTKGNGDGPPPHLTGEMRFTSTNTRVTFYLVFSTTPTSDPIVTNGTLESFTTYGPGYFLTINNPSPNCTVSGLIQLTFLDCDGNQLTTLDVTPLVQLTELYCYDNQLKTLEVTPLVQLTGLYCDGNQLKTLDVTRLVQLTFLDCDGNQLTTLDVTPLVQLTVLYCYDNQLTTLDVTPLVQLTGLDCSGNQLTVGNAQAILDALPTVSLGRGICTIYNQTTGDLTGLLDLTSATSKNWDVS